MVCGKHMFNQMKTLAYKPKTTAVIQFVLVKLMSSKIEGGLVDMNAKRATVEQTEMSWIMWLTSRSDSARLIHKCNTGYALILFI